MTGRKWLWLPAGLAWVITRNGDLTEKLQNDPRAFEGIGRGIAALLACEEVRGQKLLTYFAGANEAWLAVRTLISDESLWAEGIRVDRHGVGPTIETSYLNAPIPSGEAGNLILLNDWRGFAETVLGPDETYRFQNGQGRYWKRVRLSAQELFAAFRPVQDVEKLVPSTELAHVSNGTSAGRVSAAEHQANPFLAYLHWDFRSFVDIAQAWSKVAGEPRETMLAGLIHAFLRGEFERNAGSTSAVFELKKPKGNYELRENVVYKVDEDGVSYVSAERVEEPWFQRDVAAALSMLGRFRWDSNEGPEALATIPLNAYPDVFQEYFLRFCIRRSDFAVWYSTWSHTAGAAIERFWPAQSVADDALDHARALPNEPAAEPNKPAAEPNEPAAEPRKRGRKQDPLWALCRTEAMKLLELKGVPRSDDEDPQWRKQADLERWIHDWWVKNLPPNGAPPAESTVRSYASDWLSGYNMEVGD